jgi:hypothetical protein
MAGEREKRLKLLSRCMLFNCTHCAAVSQQHPFASLVFTLLQSQGGKFLGCRRGQLCSEGAGAGTVE